MPLREVTPVNATLAFVRNAALSQRRLDGRRMRDYRSLQINVPLASDALGNGKAEVILGTTRYSFRITCVVITAHKTDFFFGRCSMHAQNAMRANARARFIQSACSCHVRNR